MILRILRITVIAIGFSAVFRWSRHATLARGGEDLPGISWALAVLAVLFTAGAAASERLKGPEANLQKDMLWGLAAGAIITIISRF